MTTERDGEHVDAEWLADAASLQWCRDDGSYVAAAFSGPRGLRLSGHGLQLRLTEATGELTAFSGGYLFIDPVDGAAVLTSYETGRRYRIRMIHGSMECAGVEALGRSERSIVLGSPGENWDAELIEATTGAEQPRSQRAFEDVVEAADSAFTQY